MAQTVDVEITVQSQTVEVELTGATGPAGAAGAAGATGATGATGQGIPSGGTTSQVLSKNSNTDFDTGWSTLQSMAYTLQASTQGFNPNDGTTYYIGMQAGNTPFNNADRAKVHIPRAGTIKSCYINIFNSSVGTTEASTISIRLNNTTDTAITTAIDNSVNPSVASNTALSIPVVAGDYFELKWACPTWVTNPTGVRISAVIYIEA